MFTYSDKKSQITSIVAAILCVVLIILQFLPFWTYNTETKTIYNDKALLAADRAEDEKNEAAYNKVKDAVKAAIDASTALTIAQAEAEKTRVEALTGMAQLEGTEYDASVDNDPVTAIFTNNAVGAFLDAAGQVGEFTRGEVVMALHEMAGFPSASGRVPFDDINDMQDTNEALYNAVRWARREKLLGSIDGDNFEPEKQATREELADMLYGYDSYLAKKIEKSNTLKEMDDYEPVVRDVSIQGYVWFPTEHKILTSIFDTEVGGFEINSYVGMPLLALLGAVLALYFAIAKGDSPLFGGIASLLCGVGTLILVLTNSVIALGGSTLAMLILSIVIILVGLYQIALFASSMVKEFAKK